MSEAETRQFEKLKADLERRINQAGLKKTHGPG